PAANFFDPSTGHIISMAEGRNGRVWLGTEGHGLLVWENGAITAMPGESLVDRVLFDLAEDTNGRLWIGTEKGLRCLDANGQPVEVPPLPETTVPRVIMV